MSRRKAPLAISMLGLFAAVCLISGSAPATAADSDRAEKWQFYIPITYVSSESFNGDGGTSVELNGDIGWGFAFGYNLSEQFLVGFEITWTNVNFNANIAQDNNGNGTPDEIFSASGTLDASTLALTGQWNILEKTVTPFIRAGLGGTYIDSNIASGPATGTCWWYPYWGYVCGTYQNTYDRNSFSYSVGIGVRADITDTFFLELSYNSMWIDSSSGTPNLKGGRLNIAWMF